jgi:hypothetical protein
MSLNEYCIRVQDNSHELKTSMKGMTFTEDSVSDSLVHFDNLRFGQFNVLPGALGETPPEDLKENEAQYSVFIPLERNRLSVLDAIWLYPIVIWLVIEITLWYYGLEFAILSNQTILGWYYPFYQDIIRVLSLFIGDHFASAFALFTLPASLIELTITVPLYLVLKFFLSWLPSKIWYYLLLVFTDIRN